MTAGLSGSLPAEEDAFLLKYRFPKADSAAPGPETVALSRSLPASFSGLSDYEKAEKLMHLAHDTLSCLPGTTPVDTSAEEAQRGGCGVCQDYAHVMIALCRRAGLAACYVFGFITGEGASHAWVEVLCRDRWFPSDPTNNHPCTDSCIRVGCGRTGRDCPMNRGILCGAPSQTLSIQVRVEEKNQHD